MQNMLRKQVLSSITDVKNAIELLNIRKIPDDLCKPKYNVVFIDFGNAGAISKEAASQRYGTDNKRDKDGINLARKVISWYWHVYWVVAKPTREWVVSYTE